MDSAYSKQEKAFTLIELMIGIAIAAILLTLGIPSFREMMQNNRGQAFAGDFIHALHYARNEAISRGVTVSVCASNSSQSQCGAAADWTNGWLIFIDDNNDGAYLNGTDTLLAVKEGATNGTITAASSVVSYNSSGFLTQGVGNYVLAATGCSGNNARTVNINTVGRIAVTSTACP